MKETTTRDDLRLLVLRALADVCDGTYSGDRDDAARDTQSWALELLPGANGIVDPVGDFAKLLVKRIEHFIEDELGVEVKGIPEAPVAPVVQTFTVHTEGEVTDPSELSITGASIPEEQLDMLLRTPPGIVYAKNQDGVMIELMLDMDEDSLIARGVELTHAGAVYLSPSDDLADNASLKP